MIQSKTSKTLPKMMLSLQFLFKAIHLGLWSPLTFATTDNRQQTTMFKRSKVKPVSFKSAWLWWTGLKIIALWPLFGLDCLSCKKKKKKKKRISARMYICICICIYMYIYKSEKWKEAAVDELFNEYKTVWAENPFFDWLRSTWYSYLLTYSLSLSLSLIIYIYKKFNFNKNSSSSKSYFI